MARTFSARFDSECNGCYGAIFEGDEVGYLDGEVVCETCLTEAEDA